MKRQPPGQHADNENLLISGLQNVRNYLGDKVTTVRENCDPGYFEEAWKNFRTKLSEVGSTVEEKKAELFAATTVLLHEKELLHWTQELTAGAATVYDKAMDANYLETHIGGGYHRIFDGRHTIAASWDAVRDAAKSDDKAEEIVAWAHAYIKDFTTPMGMPFITLDKATFDGWVDALAGKIPGLDRNYLYDLLTFDAMETISTSLSVVAVCFAFSKDDMKKLAEILGAMGISSITAANPILGVATVTAAAYAYWKHGSIDITGVLKGGGLAAFSAVMFSIMGFPILVELSIVVTLSILLRKQIVDNEDFTNWLKLKIQECLYSSEKLVNIQTLLSFFHRLRRHR